MLRIMLTLQHSMAGFREKSKGETSSFYMKLMSLLAEECAEWLKSVTD